MVNQNYTPQAENYFVQKPQYVMPTKNSAIVQFRDGTMYVQAAIGDISVWDDKVFGRPFYFDLRPLVEGLVMPASIPYPQPTETEQMFRNINLPELSVRVKEMGYTEWQTETFRLLHAGLPDSLTTFLLTKRYSLEEFLRKKGFLSIGPLKRKTSLQQPEYLDFFNLTDHTELQLRLRALTKVGWLSVYFPFLCEKYAIKRMHVQSAIFDFNFLFQEPEIERYELAVCAGTTPVSEYREYAIESHHSTNTQYFGFINSIGGMETFSVENITEKISTKKEFSLKNITTNESRCTAVENINEFTATINTPKTAEEATFYAEFLQAEYTYRFFPSEKTIQRIYLPEGNTTIGTAANYFTFQYII